jgi:hypothetical protein
MTNVVQLPTKLNEETDNASVAVPEFITMSDIEHMSDEQLDAMVAAIRARRMNSYVIYKRTKEEKDAVSDAKTKARIEKKCEMIIKQLNKLDDGTETLERYIAELRGLRLQAGLALV